MLSKRLEQLLPGVVLVAAVACGGDGGGGGGGSGVSASKVAKDLSAEEATKVCKFIQGRAPDFGDEEICTLIAAVGTDTKEACEQGVTYCLDNGLSESLAGDEDDCDQASTDVSDCEATVGEIEDCINAVRAQVSDAIESASCEDAGSIDESAVTKLPPACNVIQEKCSKLLDD